MCEKSLKEKIGWKPGQRVLLAGLPQGVANPFGGIEHTQVGAREAWPEGSFDLVLGFCHDAAALHVSAGGMMGSAGESGKLWVCYPKGSSKVKTDLTRDTGWEPMFNAGWIVVAIASVDATWSAVRFRPKHLVKSTRG
jgi:hypothetical protein